MAIDTTSWVESAACTGKTDVFFPTHHNTSTTNKARDICRRCPLYERCVEYWLPRYEEAPYGIMFGYTEVERRQMDDGLMEYRDWRNDAKLVSKRTLAAMERHAAKKGVKAVTDVYRIYEVEDYDERRAIIDAYEAWLVEQRIAGAHEAAEMRAEYHRDLKRRLYERDREQILEERSQQRAAEREAKRPQVLQAIKEGAEQVHLPADLRPECPNGHGQRDMAKSRRKGRTVWTCYLCRAKVEADPRELAEAALRSA